MVERVRRKMKVWNLRKSIIYFLTSCLMLNTWLPSVLADVPPAPNALPSGGSVPTGYGSVGQFDYSITGELHVRDVAEQTVVNWDNFDIGVNASVQFHQLGINPAVLNRITGEGPTGIFGSLQANGRVFIVNPAGIVFGANSTVNVTQLVASGLAMSNTDFSNAVGDSAQPMIFSSGSGDVTNNGTLTATDSVYLVGEDVMNKGTILCPGGLVVLAAGDTLRLGQPGSSVFVDIGTDLIADIDNFASNSGTIGEAGSPVGQVVLAAGDIFSEAIANIENLAVVANENVIFDRDVEVTGRVDVLAG
jgi:filamentous hemagglutinin family protein